MKLKIKEVAPHTYSFVDSGKENMTLVDARIIIRKYSGQAKDLKNTYELVYIFPILHENGIDSEIKRLQIAKQAIKKIKSNLLK